jgi:IS5 family transposase
MKQPGFFDLDERYESLSKQGDPLEVIETSIPWSTFRPILKKLQKKERKSNAGRKAYDPILMFKILVLQSLYNLSDEQAEYQIKDRLSFMRFLRLGFEDRIPDATTIWLFRETLINNEVIESLFNQFNRYLDGQGYQAKRGQIVDASIVPVPKQRNTREENARIKQGEVPEEWDSTPHKRSQKDVDARWTKKHGKSHYGYKNHINVDNHHKLIRRFEVTDAAVHDSQVFEGLLDPENTGASVWADSAYRSEETERNLQEAGYRSRIHHKGKRNKPLSAHKQAINHKRSVVRARVEHVFGYQENSMGGKLIRTIGLLRAKAKIGLMNLGYNMMRFTQLQRRHRVRASYA